MAVNSLGCAYAVVIETTSSSRQRVYSLHLEYDEAMNRADSYNSSYALFKTGATDNVAKVIRINMVPVI